MTEPTQTTRPYLPFRIKVTYWHCGSCGWSQPSAGEPLECEMCGEEDMSPEAEIDAEQS